MELQWPLILFTTFIAWAAGLVAAQSIAALKDEAPKAQIPSIITAFVLLVIGGIAVFLHLEHWERIFNGFGHLSSGITQELIGIVVLIVLMVIFFVQARKADGKVAKWLSIASIAVAVILVIVMAHSYIMASRPAWNTFLWVLAVLGSACVLGPATFAVIAELTDKDASLKTTGLVAVIGAIAAALFSLLYIFGLQSVSSEFATVGYYFDVTHPTYPLIDLSSITNVLGGDNALLVWGGIVIIGAIVPIIATLMGKLKGNWKCWGAIAVVCALVGAICIRVLFFKMGYLFYMFY